MVTKLQEFVKADQRICPISLLIPDQPSLCYEKKCAWWIEQPLSKGCAIKMLAMRFKNG